MDGVRAAWWTEFAGIRGTLRAQLNWAEDLATGVNDRIQALEDGLAQLAHAAQGLAKQSGPPGR
eukprot:14513591-Alexandrium_andersonii.AAC.1